MLKNRRAQGFTLLEIMVAITIFAVLAAMAYGGLNSIVRAQIAVRERSDQLDALNRALTLFEKDVSQALPRGARGAYGASEAALVGDRFGLTLSTTVLTAAASGPLAIGVRVRHSFAQGRWLRGQFAGLDLAPNTPETARLILTDCTDVSLRYFDADLRAQDRWPPANAIDVGAVPPGAGANTSDVLPRAIELRLTLKPFGEIRRLIAVSEVQQ